MTTHSIRERKVVVADPGAIPEMRQMASALASADLLASYIAPVATEDGRALRMLPRRAASLFRRRAVPEGVDLGRVQRAAAGSELIFVASRRLPIPESVQDRLMRRRNRIFDAAASRTLRPSHHAVVATNGSALRTLQRAHELGVRSFLNCSIAHHAFAEAILQEEALLHPSFADTLQYHRFKPSVARQLEDELEAADVVLTLSSFQARTFVEAGVSASKIVTIPLGVDAELFRPFPRTNKDVFRVVFVGQITQRKGISYLLEAFELAELPQSELLLVGRPVGEVAVLAGRRNVRHIPHVSRWELPAIYGSADVYVLPSLVEGFGLTALEAMASGVPVILSDHTFGADVMTDGEEGFVVPIRSSKAIAERLRRLHGDPEERARMGRAGRECAERFSWAAYERRIVAVLTGSTADQLVA